jgi:hypothetical protein
MMSATLERRLLQICVALVGALAVMGGFQGLMSGLGGNSYADSHYRYLSGILLGVGAAFWASIPDIEVKGELFRVLTLMIAIGGLARLGAALAQGGDQGVWGAIAVEVVVVPVLCLWRERIERLDLQRPPGYRGPWQ